MSYNLEKSLIIDVIERVSEQGDSPLSSGQRQVRSAGFICGAVTGSYCDCEASGVAQC